MNFNIIYIEYFEQFLSIAIIHFLAVLSPGPDFAIVLKNSVISGRKSALLTSFGISIGIIIHVIYCIMGIGYIISNNILLFNIIKNIGAFYLFYIGIRSIINKKQNVKYINDAHVSEKLNNKRFFLNGFITNVFNPKATLFFISLFSLFIDHATPMTIQIFYGIWMTIITFLWFCFVSFFFTSNVTKIFISKYAILIDKIMGVVLVYISIKLIWY